MSVVYNRVAYFEMTNKLNKLDKFDNWINLGDWDKIENNLDRDNVNKIIHLAILNSRNQVIKYAMKNNKNSFNLQDDNGNTPAHLMARFGLFDMFCKVVGKMPKLINNINNKSQTPLHILFKKNNLEAIKWAVDNTNPDYSLKDSKQRTVIDMLVDKVNKESDEWYNILDKILDSKKLDKQDGLFNATKDKKPEVVKLFLKHGADPNSYDKDYLTPIQVAIFEGSEETTKLLAKSGADVNSTGPEGDQDPMMVAIIKGDEELINLLLDNGYNPNLYNRYLETATHGIFSRNIFKPSTIVKILCSGDLTFKNVDGLTPLHMFLQNYDWKDFKEILKTKKLDIYAVDISGKMPIDLIKQEDRDDFFDLVTDSFINTSKKKLNRDQVRSQILKSGKSYYEDANELELDKNFKFIQDKYSSDGRFNADTLHNIIYTLELLKRHDNLGIPFQRTDNTDNIDLYVNQNSPEQKVRNNIVRLYQTYCFEVLPYLAIWHSPDVWFVHPDLEICLISVMSKPDIDLIFMKLTLIASVNGTHANTLIIDKINKRIDRFEPYGIVPYLDNDKFDEILKSRLLKFLKEFTGDEYEYLGPKDIIEGKGLQIISNDTNSSIKNLGDPNGYCLAWCIWYIEMRLANPDIHPKTLIRRSIRKIVDSYPNILGEYKFIYFIRNYAHRLDRMKNQFLVNIGVPIQNLYNLALPENEMKHVLAIISDHFAKYIFPRLE